MPQKFVRVRLPNGTEKSIPEVVARTSGYTVLDKDAYGRDGRLKPAKPRVALGDTPKNTRRRKPAASADDTNPQASPASDTPEE
jgi:hypothetical protein